MCSAVLQGWDGATPVDQRQTKEISQTAGSAHRSRNKTRWDLVLHKFISKCLLHQRCSTNNGHQENTCSRFPWPTNQFISADLRRLTAFVCLCVRAAVYVCKLADGEQPLFLRLLAGPDTDTLSFVLREQQTGEVMVRLSSKKLYFSEMFCTNCLFWPK